VNDGRTLALLAGALVLFWGLRARAREPAGELGVIGPVPWEGWNLPPARQLLADQAFQAASVAGVPPSGFTAQLYVESLFDPDAVSSAGAVGLAQFMPGAGVDYGLITMPAGDKSAFYAALAHARSNLSGDELSDRIRQLTATMLASSRTTDHRTDPTRSINAGLEYMRVLHRRYEDEADPWSLALAAYNWGPGNVNAWLAGRKSPPATTRRYVEMIAPYYGEDPVWAGAANV
jgi:soluble lytic murein transglycosylase-like protein